MKNIYMCKKCLIKPVLVYTNLGLCDKCYHKQLEEKNSEECVKCHKVKPIHGRGLCNSCYKTEWAKQKRKKDKVFNFSCNVRSLISHSFERANGKGLIKNLSTEEILGCSIEEFRKYIESKFQEGMTLENYGKWHLDHIIPISLAQTEEEVIKLCHYSNFQPL